ncbi:formate dehydrogenase accessory sulfurtransferase FdhD [Sphingobium sp. Sx8-8]|uniref:formate dehydrogenase accessory sulfurtransferase FdhD n=1 Tax=Sphingobium sp. Sx8-8 TaxID=2933617 RepID=UPI001F56ED36|nr:formate dehydrogenase accessory sulfurtransferase FdhD [Sphingobium sp. Sx8-8]
MLVEPEVTGAQRRSFVKVAPNGVYSPIERDVAEEVPIAIELNGIGYAVLMATPDHIEDLVAGFVLSERLIERGVAIPDPAIHQPELGGLLVRLQVPQNTAESIMQRVRHRVSNSSCGLCGIENLEQAMRPLPVVSARSSASEEAVFAALAEIDRCQSLNGRTGAVHAAALCHPNGRVRLVREDIGRHNALDKLIGAMARSGAEWDEGFCLVTSRCSYELVEKAVLAECPMLVTISAPTSLAIQRAGEAGLSLRVLARRDSFLAMS